MKRPHHVLLAVHLPGSAPDTPRYDVRANSRKAAGEIAFMRWLKECARTGPPLPDGAHVVRACVRADSVGAAGALALVFEVVVRAPVEASAPRTVEYQIWPASVWDAVPVPLASRSPVTL